MRTFASVDELAAAVGETLGPGPWQRIEQSRVDLFADATDDHQWIHLDPERPPPACTAARSPTVS